MKASKLNSLVETGGADQDYEHEYYTAICKEITKQTGYRCTHKEFDKYQGIFLYVASPKGKVTVMPSRGENDDIEEGWMIAGDPEGVVYQVFVDDKYRVNDYGLAEALKLHFEKKTEDYKYGFDLTGFNSPVEWKQVLAVVGIPSVAKLQEGEGFFWKGDNILIVTANNPITGEYYRPGKRDKEKGYASYIGIQGEKNKVMKVVDKIKAVTSDIKDESPGERDYI